MRAVEDARPTGLIARLLAVLSVAGFWVLPWSPLVAIAAVSMTGRSSGWARRAAVTGAVLTIAWTVALACLLLAVYSRMRSGM
jgi:hypothetical protein